MVISALSDPPAPSLQRGDSYGYNLPGELGRTVVVMVAELLVLIAVLRPWSYRHSWGRALLALLLLTPWALLNFVATMHSGRIAAVHVFWLAGVWFAMPIATIHALEMRFRSRRTAAEPGVAADAGRE
jgi:hypothetical protein